ncbi:MAG: helix-turn-helix domain-containing protein [Planctomycetaceae bacterium]|nr:helix-turn-helix domain-containing protein [Planctomycetaceae bacterium]
MQEQDTRVVFRRVQEGDQAAAREIFDRYVHRLTALARGHLSASIRQRLDAEDVLQSAFRSFFTRAREGQYVLERSGDLWRLLAAITRNKVLKKSEHHMQQRRDFRRDHSAGEPPELSDVQEAVSEDVLELMDEVENLSRQFSVEQQQMIALRLQGVAIPDVAESVGRSERTVRRMLQRFRGMLEERLDGLRDADTNSTNERPV